MVWIAVNSAWYILQAKVEYAQLMAEEDDLVWRRVQCIVEDTTSTEPADDAVVTFDIVNYTSGGIDTSWTDQDYITCTTHLDLFWNAYLPYLSAGHRLKEYRWYIRQFAPMPATEPPNLNDIADFQDSGGPVRIDARSMAGTTTPPLPPQCSISVTEETPTRRNWGRFYLPFPGASVVSAAGRLAPTQQAAIASATETFFTGMTSDDFPVVVPLTRIDGNRVHQLQTIGAIRVDDVFDTIRRRRHKSALVREIRPIP